MCCFSSSQLLRHLIFPLNVVFECRSSHAKKRDGMSFQSKQKTIIYLCLTIVQREHILPLNIPHLRWSHKNKTVNWKINKALRRSWNWKPQKYLRSRSSIHSDIVYHTHLPVWWADSLKMRVECCSTAKIMWMSEANSTHAEDDSANCNSANLSLLLSSKRVVFACLCNNESPLLSFERPKKKIFQLIAILSSKRCF